MASERLVLLAAVRISMARRSRMPPSQEELLRFVAPGETIESDAVLAPGVLAADVLQEAGYIWKIVGEVPNDTGKMVMLLKWRKPCCESTCRSSPARRRRP